MRRFPSIVLLLLSAVSLSAGTITRVSPVQGFTFANTTVTLTGTDLSPASFTCTNAEPCPMTVRFGSQPGQVLKVTPQAVTALAPPQAHGTVVDVTLRLAGQETTIAQAFRYDRYAHADRVDYEQYLLPITKQRTAGADGSLWQTEWKLFNASSHPLAMIWAHCPANVSPCPPSTIGPRETTYLGSYSSSFDSDGGFFYVPKALAPHVSSSLRVRDLSQNSRNFGVEVPVVRVATDYTNQLRGVHRLLDVPTDEKYRATLRIYGAEHHPQRVHVAIYSESSETPLEDFDIDLNGYVNVVFDPFPLSPAYAQLDPLTAKVRAAGERVRIEVSALSDLLISPPLVVPTYAFVSLTNNESQEVTTITPHR